MFAYNTGGLTVTRTNDPWRRVPEMFVENASYYMLGVEPPAERARSGFHPIRVQVTRPGLTVRTRSGYYDPAPERRRPVSLTALDRAMDGPVPLADLPLSLAAAAFRVPRDPRAAVALVAGVDGAPERLENVDVAVRAFRNGRANGVRNFRMRLEPQTSAFGSVHYDARMRLDLAPGSYEVRLSMQRDSDKVAGGVAISLDIPDFGREPLSVSGVVLGRLAESTLGRKDLLAGVLPFGPTTRRAFGRSEVVAALVCAYQSGRDRIRPVSLATRIVSETGATVFDSTVNLPPDAFVGPERAAEQQFRLPLAALPAGEYLLQFEAALGTRTERATPVRFRVK